MGVIVLALVTATIFAGVYAQPKLHDSTIGGDVIKVMPIGLTSDGRPYGAAKFYDWSPQMLRVQVP